MTKLIVTTRDGATQELEIKPGLSVMESMRENGIYEVQAICGGCCSCATCHVHVDDAFKGLLPAMKSDEDELLDSSSHRTQSSRISCQIQFTTALDGLRITIAPED